MIGFLTATEEALVFHTSQKIQLVLGAILVILAAVLIVLVLKQSGKEKGLSGTIAGGAETYFGKNQGQSTDKKLSKATIVLTVLIVIITVALTVLTYRYNLLGGSADFKF
ncbi:MAG: preprotein translocase subunit SecG [Clostridia bacterium]|nr:preprotein translocase subunit SecG [Clostridia bacterium]